MNIMIADSSAVVRAIFAQNFQNNKNIRFTASVSSCQKLLALADSDKPDVIICGNDLLDPEEKNAFNSLCNEYNLPILVMTGNETTALPSSVETIRKPNLRNYTPEFFDLILNKLNSIASKNPSADSSKGGFKILCLGASTGGPTAVAEVLCGLGNNFPLPIVYTQHIEVDADVKLVSWLKGVCKNLKVKLAEDGETAQAGTVYMAPADRHLLISYVNATGKAVLELSDDEPERYLRPAVNKLFKSAAEKFKNKTLAILLTGMGADGATGCKEICDQGGWTIVEDKSTCAVFGMPAAAIEAGGAKEVLPRQDIAKRILELAGK